MRYIYRAFRYFISPCLPHMCYLLLIQAEKQVKKLNIGIYVYNLSSHMKTQVTTDELKQYLLH